MNLNYQGNTSATRYPNYVVKADEEVSRFCIDSKNKTFNAWLYNEQELVNRILEKYPNAERIAHVDRSKKRRTGKMTYKAKVGNERTYIKTQTML